MSLTEKEKDRVRELLHQRWMAALEAVSPELVAGTTALTAAQQQLAAARQEVVQAQAAAQATAHTIQAARLAAQAQAQAATSAAEAAVSAARVALTAAREQKRAAEAAYQALRRTEPDRFDALQNRVQLEVQRARDDVFPPEVVATVLAERDTVQTAWEDPHPDAPPLPPAEGDDAPITFTCHGRKQTWLL